ncbi:MAG: phosphoenolpyruvate synthase regulatory protein [Thermobacillus sp. ZCTH02-B1]|mgnify:FL=1|nr:MAG: phosphoenolpyruvate synthase regulatory protein [Thermobacillus sp. ZCTH02-B1]
MDGFRMDGSDRPCVIYAVSDSAGETGEAVVRAAVAQFQTARTEIRRRPFVKDRRQLAAIVTEAREERAIILYTLVLPHLREAMARYAERDGVKAIDALGPLMDALEERTGVRPEYKPGLNHQLDDDYFRRVEAVEFAVKHDDAKDPSGILKADIVLIGVSRTSKTPLSMYLAHRKFKVANVPLVPELKPPDELMRVPRWRIIGLTIGMQDLNQIRKERLKALGLPDTAPYAAPERIERELAYARDVMERLGCLVIDVSRRAVEETASLIMEHIRKAGGQWI